MTDVAIFCGLVAVAGGIIVGLALVADAIRGKK